MSALGYELRRLAGHEGPAPASVRSELRRWYWRFVRRHAYEICQDCGGPVFRRVGTWWSAPDELWCEVVGTEYGALCPPCFTARCDAKGLLVFWQPVVDARTS